MTWFEPLGASKSSKVIESLDGLHFSFGPASFQQTNLPVFEKILQEQLAVSIQHTSAY